MIPNVAPSQLSLRTKKDHQGIQGITTFSAENVVQQKNLKHDGLAVFPVLPTTTSDHKGPLQGVGVDCLHDRS